MQLIRSWLLNLIFACSKWLVLAKSVDKENYCRFHHRHENVCTCVGRSNCKSNFSSNDCHKKRRNNNFHLHFWPVMIFRKNEFLPPSILFLDLSRSSEFYARNWGEINTIRSSIKLLPSNMAASTALIGTLRC